MSRNTLSSLFLLREDSRSNIVHILKLPQAIADEFHKIDPKHSYTLARMIAARYDLNQGNWEEWKTAQGISDDQELAHEIIDRFMEMHGTKTLEFLRAGGRFKTSIKPIDMFDIVKTWSLRKTLKPPTFLKLDDEWAWYGPLSENEKDYEGEMMRHCGDNQTGEMYSLRNKNNFPIVTLSWNEETNIIDQIKGRANEQPKREYWDMIKKFFDKTSAKLRDGEVSKEFTDHMNDQENR